MILPTNVLSAKDLWKIYVGGGRRVEALRGVNVVVEKGTITTLLGKNGAGKTTFLRIAATQLLPTKGEITIFGYDAVKDPWPIRERIAVVPQDARPLLFPSPLEYVQTVLVMRGFSFSDARLNAVRSLEEMEIPRELWNKSSWSLSGGMRRRVLLAAVLAADAELIFLDEPSIGLDPLARRGLWSKISKLREQGKTILLTTHYMEEAEVLSDKVILIHEGQIYLEGEPKKLVDTLKWKYKLEILNQCFLDGVEDIGYVFGDSPPFSIYVDDEEKVSNMIKILSRKGCKITVSQTTLEDVFVLTVGTRGEEVE